MAVGYMKKTIIICILLTIYGFGGAFDNLKHEQIPLEGLDKVKALSKICAPIYKTAPDSCISIARQTLDILFNLEKTTAVKEAIQEVSFYLGASYFYLGDYEKIEPVVNTSLNYTDNLQNHIFHIRLVNLMANVYKYTGDLVTAQDYYLKALELCDIYDDLENKRMVLNNTANNYSTLHQYDKALEYYNKALKIAHSTDNLEYQAMIYNNIANILTYQNKPDKAIEYYQKSIQIAEMLDDQQLLTNFLINVASFYLDEKQYQKSKALSMQALVKVKQINNLNLEANVLGILGSIYTKLAEYDSAKVYLMASHRLAQQNHYDNLHSIAGLYLSELYAEIGDLENAYKYLLEHQKLKDNALIKENTREIANIQKSYELRKSKRELEEILNEKKYQSMLLRSISMRNHFLIAALLVASFLAGFVIYLYLKQTKRERMLQETVKEKSMALKRNKLLVREMNHRVKNNLTIISSLLGLSSNQTLDPDSRSVLKDSQHRVATIASLHNLLQVDKDLKQLSISQYINSLVDDITQSMIRDDMDIHVIKEIEEIAVDVSVLLPVGLIINECVTNAIKYAFPNRKNNELLIAIKSVDVETLQIIVKDNGAGISPENYSDNDNSLGMNIINSLTRQLDGQFQINTSPMAGTEAIITFKNVENN